MQKLVIWISFLALVLGDVSHLFNSKYSNRHSNYFVYDSEEFVPQLQQYSNYRMPEYNEHPIPIISQHQNIESSGYNWGFATANGIAAEEIAIINKEDSKQTSKTVRGSYQYTSPEGIPVLVTYTADENGFQPQVIANTGSVYDVLPDFYKTPIYK